MLTLTGFLPCRVVQGFTQGCLGGTIAKRIEVENSSRHRGSIYSVTSAMRYPQSRADRTFAQTGDFYSLISGFDGLDIDWEHIEIDTGAELWALLQYVEN